VVRRGGVGFGLVGKNPLLTINVNVMAFVGIGSRLGRHLADPTVLIDCTVAQIVKLVKRVIILPRDSQPDF